MAHSLRKAAQAASKLGTSLVAAHLVAAFLVVALPALGLAFGLPGPDGPAAHAFLHDAPQDGNSQATNSGSVQPGAAQGVSVDEKLLAAQAQRVEVVERARSATVAVFATGGRGGGSGVLISPDGFALSNFHVTSGAGNAMQCGLSDGKLYDAVIVGIDPTGDVALIKLLGREDFPFAPLGDSDKLRPGDGCYAMGNPFLLATDFQPTVTYGIVSGVHRYQYPSGSLLEYADCIQTDASINPGNSGGPLFNMDGEVVGINGRGSFEKRGRVNVGVGYAISINQIKHFMGYLRSGRIVDHATLGAVVRTSDDGRVLVVDILDNSDAYRRGLRYGDEIVSFGGRQIFTTNGFKNALGIFPKGWRVPLTFRRDSENHEVYVRLTGVHRENELIAKVQGREEPQPEPQPKDDQGNPQPDENPQPTQATPGMPAQVTAVFEARSGYMNYYFNRLEQERVWQSLTSTSPFKAKETWKLITETPANLKVEMELRPDGAKVDLPGGTAELTVDQQLPSLSTATEPLGSGGMLGALYCWRRFMTGGVNGFGVMYYQGKTPIAGYQDPPPPAFTSSLVDCLIGEHGGAECRFYVDSQTGQLLVMEFYPDKDSDPCELHFRGQKQVNGYTLPAEIEVRFGGLSYMKLAVADATFAAAAGELP